MKFLASLSIKHLDLKVIDLVPILEIISGFVMLLRAKGFDVWMGVTWPNGFDPVITLAFYPWKKYYNFYLPSMIILENFEFRYRIGGSNLGRRG